MIKHLAHKNIDKMRWDECINLSPHGIINAQSWYLDIVSPGWEALVEEDYAFVFPLTARKKFGINYLFQPYFTQQLGLFGRESIPGESKLTEFLLHIPSKYKLIEIQLNTDNIVGIPVGFEITKKRTFHLNLSATEGTLLNNYSENIKRNISKAVKGSLLVTENVSCKEIIQLFRSNRGNTISKLKDKDYRVFEILCKQAKQNALLESYGIDNTHGKLIAGAIFLKSFHSYILIFSGAGEEARQVGAMSMLVDYFIRKHSGESKHLDFEGSMDENLARFYRSFGSSEVVYLQIRRNLLPPLLRLFK